MKICPTLKIFVVIIARKYSTNRETALERLFRSKEEISLGSGANLESNITKRSQWYRVGAYAPTYAHMS